MGLLKNIYHYCLSWLGSIIYSHPSKRLFVIGVTGTKGKTSTVELIQAALNANGKKTAVLSSAHIKYGDEVVVNPKSNTMPGRFFIQKFLATALKKGCTHAVFEVTSQGVVQHRHRFIDFDVAAVTNLHPEHIESHGSFEKYREAKVSFFRYVSLYSHKAHPLFFINEVMADKSHFATAVARGKTVFYSREKFVTGVLHGDTTVVSGWLQSEFNLENAALAYEVAARCDVSKEGILKVLHTFKGVSGRQEFVIGKQGLRAVIDYALTPQSLEALYVFLKSKLSHEDKGGKLIAVFGSAGGGRDIWKRPALGEVASRYCDHIFLTTDDTYDEDPGAIIRDIAEGVEDASKVTSVVSRREAIERALSAAKPEDIVAITGMGSQVNTYGPGGKKIPWSDKKVVEEIFSSL